MIETEFAWPNGSIVTARAFAVLDDLPSEVVQSVRCLVFTDDDHVVMCENARGVRHVWPGGRRELGETFEQTACREVLEETGWVLDPASLTQIGWLHYEAGPHRGPDIPWPHPDIFHALFTGRARSREAEDWIDTEGYELSSRSVSTARVLRAITPGDAATPLLESHLDRRVRRAGA
jgi:8-oxo-dGTP pyrophosphatase MutT (NUDIX family)